MSATLELLRQKIAHKLVSLETLLPPDYELTLVARNKANDEAHIVVTSEKRLAAVVAAIEKLYPEDKQ